MKRIVRSILVFAALFFSSVAAHAQFAPPSCAVEFVFCFGANPGTLTVGVTWSSFSTQANRELYVAQQISSGLDKAGININYAGATFVVTFADGSTEKYKFVGNKVNGATETIPGTKTPPTTVAGGGDGGSCYYDTPTTMTFYLTTIWYVPSTGVITDVTSVPFEVSFGGGSYCV